jgi:hypothetical protein
MINQITRIRRWICCHLQKEQFHLIWWDWSIKVIVTYIYADTLADQIRIQVRCKNMADAINRTGAHRANLLDMTSFVQNTAQAKKFVASLTCWLFIVIFMGRS